MTDIRSRLTDALREHLYEWRDHGWHCAKCDVPPSDVPRDEDSDDWSSEHVISVLLSLPGVAIVDPADIREAMRSPHINWREHVAAISRLEAAAEAAERNARE